MSSLTRTFCCLAAGFVSFWVGFLVAAVFVPLIVPASLARPDTSEDKGVMLIVAISAVCVVAGFAVCWKFTAKWVRE